MSFVSRLVLLFAIATLLLSVQGPLDPSCVASGYPAAMPVCHHDADAPTVDHPDDSAEDALQLADPPPLALLSPITLESLARSNNLLLQARTIAPLDQPPRSS